MYGNCCGETGVWLVFLAFLNWLCNFVVCVMSTYDSTAATQQDPVVSDVSLRMGIVLTSLMMGVVVMGLRVRGVCLGIVVLSFISVSRFSFIYWQTSGGETMLTSTCRWQRMEFLWRWMSSRVWRLWVSGNVW